MKIEFLGNGNITSDNFNASYLINDQVLIDAPPGTSKILKSYGYNVSDIDVIMITNMLGENYFDLPFILYNEYIKQRQNELSIIGPKDLLKRLKRLLKLAFPDLYLTILNSLNLNIIDASHVYNLGLGTCSVSAVSLVNGKLKACYGYIFNYNDKKIGLIGTTELCPGLSYIISKVNACIINVSDNEAKNYLNIDEFIKLCKKHNITFLPAHYIDKNISKLEEISNVKIINSHEQFYL